MRRAAWVALALSLTALAAHAAEPASVRLEELTWVELRDRVEAVRVHDQHVVVAGVGRRGAGELRHHDGDLRRALRARVDGDGAGFGRGVGIGDAEVTGRQRDDRGEQGRATKLGEESHGESRMDAW